jgi:predicted MFS family arabinose efflux permease
MAEQRSEPMNEPTGGRRSLAFISGSVFSTLSVWFAASAVLRPLKEEWQISNAEGSFLTSAVSVGFCVGCAAAAATNLADIIPPPKLILAGSVCAASANLLLLVAQGLHGAVAARFCVGLSLALVYPPGVKLLCTWFKPEERGGAIGIMFGAFCMGSASPHLLTIAEGWSWRVVIVCTSCIAAIAGALIHSCVRVGPYPFATAHFDPRQCVLVFANVRLSMVILAYSGHMWELFSFWTWVSAYAREAWALGRADSAVCAFAVVAMGGLGSWLGGAAGDRYGHARVAAATLAASGSLIVLLGALDERAPFVLRISVALLWGLAGLADSPSYATLVTACADQRSARLPARMLNLSTVSTPGCSSEPLRGCPASPPARPALPSWYAHQVCGRRSANGIGTWGRPSHCSSSRATRSQCLRCGLCRRWPTQAARGASPSPRCRSAHGPACAPSAYRASPQHGGRASREERSPNCAPATPRIGFDVPECYVLPKWQESAAPPGY